MQEMPNASFASSEWKGLVGTLPGIVLQVPFPSTGLAFVTVFVEKTIAYNCSESIVRPSTNLGTYTDVLFSAISIRVCISVIFRRSSTKDALEEGTWTSLPIG